MQKTTKKTARTEGEGAKGDDVEEKTEDVNNEKATDAKATKKVCFPAVLTCFTSVFYLAVLKAQIH